MVKSFGKDLKKTWNGKENIIAPNKDQYDPSIGYRANGPMSVYYIMIRNGNIDEHNKEISPLCSVHHTDTHTHKFPKDKQFRIKE